MSHEPGQCVTVIKLPTVSPTITGILQTFKEGDVFRFTALYDRSTQPTVQAFDYPLKILMEAKLHHEELVREVYNPFAFREHLRLAFALAVHPPEAHLLRDIDG